MPHIKVTANTKKLYKGRTFVVDSGEFGHFEKVGIGGTVPSWPVGDGLGQWGANFGTDPSRLTTTLAAKNSIANGTPNLDGSYVDTSNALGGGATAAYWYAVDGLGLDAHVIPVLVD